MFEQRKVHNGAIQMDGLRYGSDDLHSLNGEFVRVSKSTLYPHSLAVFDRDTLQFICLAKSYSEPKKESRVFAAITAEIGRESGKVPDSFEAWVQRAGEDMQAVHNHARNGKKLHAMDGLLRLASDCVQCIEDEIMKESVSDGPSFKASIEQDKKTADPVDPEPAA